MASPCFKTQPVPPEQLPAPPPPNVIFHSLTEQNQNSLCWNTLPFIITRGTVQFSIWSDREDDPEK